MPNHFHFVIESSHHQSLSRFMQWLLTSHVWRYHKHYGSSGHVWQEQICRTNGSILQAASGQGKLTMSGAALYKTYL
jgi:REP element-mobilizing transposase RayT